MADVRHRTTFGNRLRFLLRLLGIGGFLVGVCALVHLYFERSLLAETGGDAPALDLRLDPNAISPRLLLIYIGAGLGVAWLVVELLMALMMLSGQRASANGVVYVQIALAIGLLVIVNAAGFLYYKRFDCTRDARFTLPKELVTELQTLRDDSPTDVVVLLLHKSGINRDAPRRDNVDKAGEVKVVEKVQDLVDELRELGPRFNVKVLDVEDEYFKRAANKLPKPLRDAIANAPEDSIYFHANGRVRRMGFNEFMRLDKTASQYEAKEISPEGVEETDVRSRNLVLIPQGRENFVKKLLGVEERKPRIGLVVVHRLLSSRDPSEDLGASGLRKSLEANGFEVTDIIIKKWARERTPAALTYDEFQLDAYEATANYYRVNLQNLDLAKQKLDSYATAAKTLSLTELSGVFETRNGRPNLTEADRDEIKKKIASQQAMIQERTDEFAKKLAELEPKLKPLLANDRVLEGRRNSDVPAKLKLALSECDLLIVPRLTTVDMASQPPYDAEIFNMAKEQAAVVKEFVKSGKPVMACFGPIKFGGRGDTEPDELEKLFTRMGVEFGTQTVLTDDEGTAIATKASERSGDGLADTTEIPPLVLNVTADAKKGASPVSQAIRTASRSTAAKLSIRKSGPRIVTVNARVAAKLPYSGTILESIAQSWNEEKPLPEQDYLPKFDPPKFEDPKRGTSEEERRGPFSIGVAFETALPAEWYDESLSAVQTTSSIGGAAGGLGLAATSLALDPADFAKTKIDRPTVRLAAFGHGGLFVGKQLTTGQEELLIDTVNWQLHRDDRLPKDLPDNEKWQFPRVNLNVEQSANWLTGTRVVLPAVFVFLGIAVLMLRRFR